MATDREVDNARALAASRLEGEAREQQGENRATVVEQPSTPSARLAEAAEALRDALRNQRPQEKPNRSAGHWDRTASQRLAESTAKLREALDQDEDGDYRERLTEVRDMEREQARDPAPDPGR